MSHNTWIHRTVRVGVKPIARTRVTPNQVTALRLFTGIAAAGLIAVGDDPWDDIGAALFMLSILLDRADGELARMTKKFSPSGHAFDLFSDALCNLLIFVAIGVGLRGGGILGYWAIPMGVVAGIFIALNLWVVMNIEDAKGTRAAEMKSFWGFDADDGMLLVPILIWMELDVVAMILAFIFAPIFMIWAAIYYTRQYGLLRLPLMGGLYARVSARRDR